jgi:membrane protein
VLRRALQEARDDDVGTVAQALAYALFLAIPAIGLVVLGVFSIVADPRLIDDVVERAQTVMPAEAASLVRDSLRRTSESNGQGVVMTLVGGALAVWTTTSAATTLMAGVTRAYGHDDERTFVRRRLTALVVVFALLASTVLVVGLLVLGPHLERWIGSALEAETLTAWTWWTVQWPILVAALLFAFTVVLYLGPDVTPRTWKLVTPGAVTAVVVWLAASGAFALYAARFGSYDKTWGSLSVVVVTLVWLWLTSASLLFGAEVNAEAARLERSASSEATTDAPGPPGADSARGARARARPRTRGAG